MKSIFLLSTAVLSTLSATAWAKAVESRMLYDFTQSVINAYGIHKPSGEAKNGLQAELEARKEGIRFATEQILKNCSGDESKLVEGWRNSFKSLGSTIYPKGVLEIELSSGLRDIFAAHKNAKVQAPKTSEGDLLVLKLPTLTAAQVSCGTLKLKSDGQPIYIVPVALTNSDAPLKVIPLTNNDGVLSSSDTTLAAFLKEQSAKGKGTDKAPLALPIATK